MAIPTPLDLGALTALLSDISDTETAAAAGLNAFFDAAEANKDDPAAIQALVDAGRAKNDDLAAAIAHTTGAAAPPA